MKRYDETFTSRFVIENPGEEIAFGRHSAIFDEETAILIAGSAPNVDLTIDGRLLATDFGLRGAADNSDVTIGSRATILSETGISVIGASFSLTNRGVISADKCGVEVRGHSPNVVNEGSITGNFGLMLTDAGNLQIRNGRNGEILADSVGISLAGSSAGDELEVINLGSIVSSSTSIVFGSGTHDTVINRGLIVGDVYFGTGDDRFDGRGGTLRGTVFGGDNDDKYLIDDADIKLHENFDFGTDTVISSVAYQLEEDFEILRLAGGRNLVGKGNDGDNTIIGNAGNNTLHGYEGYNTLEGGRGNDWLFGGNKTDIFVFGTGDDHDRIRNFQDNIDYVDLAGWKGLSDFDVLLSHAHEKDGNLVISFRGDQLIIENYSKAQFDIGDFPG